MFESFNETPVPAAKALPLNVINEVVEFYVYMLNNPSVNYYYAFAGFNMAKPIKAY